MSEFGTVCPVQLRMLGMSCCVRRLCLGDDELQAQQSTSVHDWIMTCELPCFADAVLPQTTNSSHMYQVEEESAERAEKKKRMLEAAQQEQQNKS